MLPVAVAAEPRSRLSPLNRFYLESPDLFRALCFSGDLFVLAVSLRIRKTTEGTVGRKAAKAFLIRN